MLKPKTHLTPAEYLAMEAVSETKHEYWDGLIVPLYPEVVGMAGASPRHADVVAELVVQFRTRLRGKCRAFASDLRVSVDHGSRYVYPDVVVVCGEARYTDGNPPSLLNPALIVEVVSPSTEDVDLGRKADAYRAIPSLLEYWVMRQDAPSLTRHIRRGEEWVARIEGGLEAVIRSEHLGIEIPLAEVYAQ
jgi:Uma2 family endonuclease